MRKVDLRDSPRDSKDFVNDAGEAIGSADDAARGRGVYAVVDIKAGERVLTVPYSACISQAGLCLLYTSPSPRDRQKSRMPSSA